MGVVIWGRQWFQSAIFCCVDNSCCYWRWFCYNVWKEFTPKTHRQQRLLLLLLVRELPPSRSASSRRMLANMKYRWKVRIIQSPMSTSPRHQSSFAATYQRSSSTVKTLWITQATTAPSWSWAMVVLGGVARLKKRWTTHRLSALHLMI